ncbi:hypothetical protein [Aliagarivorans marinus]|uniref:hypothetical protein n=1 Tax=Aliagarivorans marinus TaxID=561965 RepID=UPI0003FA8469|nr:hypothetical protein [Aliagarivorans marinus]
MNLEEREYQHFGPWLVEVDSLDDIPPQFGDISADYNGASFAFKIPIHQERRNVNMGMLLYPQLVIVHSDRMIYLNVASSQMIRQVIHYQDLLWLEHGGDLLDSHITLATSSQTLSVTYNMSSQDIASKAIRFIRNGVSPEVSEGDAAEASAQPEAEQQIFRYLCDKEQLSGSLQILGYQPSIELGPLPNNSLSNIYRNINQYRLLDSMLVCDGTELIVASRGKDVVDVRETNYKFSHTYIRLDRISGISIRPDEQFRELKQLWLELEGRRWQWRLGADFVTDDLAMLLNPSEMAVT